MPLATDVVSGERADDGLYVPAIRRVDDMLYVSDCKGGTFDSRLYIAARENYYLSQLAMVGNAAVKMEEWRKTGIEKRTNGESIKIYRKRYSRHSGSRIFLRSNG